MLKIILIIKNVCYNCYCNVKIIYNNYKLFSDTYLRPNPLPERVFRAKLRIIQGDAWTPDLADQNSSKFQHKCRDYRERIDLVVTRSDLKESYEGSEVLALDGYGVYLFIAIYNYNIIYLIFNF